MSTKQPFFTLRDGSKQGTKHVRLGLNNQDAIVSQSFTVPAYGKTFHVGIVSDGCTGHPAFSHTEVGAHLITLYAYRRVQELICSGLPVIEIPKVLYPSITECLLDIMTKIMPSHIIWNYPITIKDRERWNAQTRFKSDYLAATLLGVVSDEEDVVIFSAGDGVILVNDTLTSIDQNDHPEYPAISVNQAGKGFATQTHRASDIGRVAVASDGLKKLMQDPEFCNSIFQFKSESPNGLQTLLNITSNNFPELMLDDCTIVTLDKRNS